MPRVYVRKFDWDEARRRVAEGEPRKEVAEALGVSDAAIYRIVKEGYLEKEAERHRVWQASGSCIDCGATVMRTSKRCKVCAPFARVTTRTETELQCMRCREWKPDEAFPRNVSETTRRGRHSLCRLCGTEARREYRQRNIEKARAYDKAYKKRKRRESRESRSQ